MPSHDATRAPDPVPADRRLSRRSLLRGSAVASDPPAIGSRPIRTFPYLGVPYSGYNHPS